jgi:GH15 family glucan-1,4-alpha-glucosidase
MMAWVAFDRGIKAIERFGREGPLDRWQSIRDAIHREVCERGYDGNAGAFTQSYGSRELDASLLLMPLVGFLPASDPRIGSTIDAIERSLVTDAFVARYRTDTSVDGLPAGEGAFLACSFWLVQALALRGERNRAAHIFERVLAVQNDVGLLAEQYDTRTARQLGNFPQALSHLALVDAAYTLVPPEPRAAPKRKSRKKAR